MHVHGSFSPIASFFIHFYRPDGGELRLGGGQNLQPGSSEYNKRSVYLFEIVLRCHAKRKEWEMLLFFTARRKAENEEVDCGLFLVNDLTRRLDMPSGSWSVIPKLPLNLFICSYLISVYYHDLKLLEEIDAISSVLSSACLLFDSLALSV